MKIKDLILKLKAYNPNADITLTTSEDICLSYICEGRNGEELTPETTMLVFIEPTDECPECTHEYINSKDGVRWCSFYEKPCKDVEECNQFIENKYWED